MSRDLREVRKQALQMSAGRVPWQKDQPGQRLRLECAGKIKKSARMPEDGMEGGRELVEG